jgi:hypothetical protein
MSFTKTLILGLVALFLGVVIRRGFDHFYLRYRYSGRLFGLRLVSLYELCVGILFAVFAMFFAYAIITRHDEIQDKLIGFGRSPEKLLGDMVAISILALTAGVGLWRESQWGWNLAIFAIAIGLVRNALSLIFGQQIAPRLDQPEAFYVLQHSVRILISALLLTYLFRTYVMRHCNVDENWALHFKKLVSAVIFAVGLEVLLR